MLEPGSNPPPTLAYATPDANGLPECIPEAEALIERKASSSDLNPLFRKSTDTVRYIARSLSRRYSVEAINARCLLCDRAAPELALQVQGSVWAPARSREVRLNDTGPTEEFVTFHSICAPCRDDWFRQIGSLWWIRWALFWLGLTAWLGYILALALLYFTSSRVNWASRMTWMVIGGYVMLFIAGKVVSFIYSRRQPRQLRTIMPRDVRFLQVLGRVERKDGKVAVIPFQPELG